MLLNDLWMILMTASAVAGMLALVPVSNRRVEPVRNQGGGTTITPGTVF